MDYFYLLPVEGNEKRSNTNLIKQQIECNIPEERFYIEYDREKRSVLKSLLQTLEKDDFIVVRSVYDLADELDPLKDVLYAIEFKRAELYSLEEHCFRGRKPFTVLAEVEKVITTYGRKARVQGYKKAVAEHRVGRPHKNLKPDKEILLYKQGYLSAKNAAKLLGVSKTTFYNYLHRVDDNS